MGYVKRVVLLGSIAVFFVLIVWFAMNFGMMWGKLVTFVTGGRYAYENEKIVVKSGSGVKTLIARPGGGEFVLPETFPKDVPIFKEASIKVINVIREKDYTVSMELEDRFEELEQYYKTEIPERGWKLKTRSTYGTSANFSADKGNRNLSVSIYEDKRTGKTSITINLKEK